MISGAIACKAADERWVDPAEIEFVAENSMVTIIPKFKLGVLYMITGEYGPFLSQTPAEVPVWLAVHLKKLQRVNIKVPDWLEVEYLSSCLDQEKRDQNLSRTLPHHYSEIASMLFEVASDDIEQPDRLRTLVEDIANIRQTKLRKGMESVMENVKVGGSPNVSLTGIAALEMNKIRPSFLHGLEMFWKLRNMNKVSSEQANQVLGASSGVANGARAGAAGIANNLSRAAVLRQRVVEQARARASLAGAGSVDEGAGENEGSTAGQGNIDGGQQQDGASATDGQNPFEQTVGDFVNPGAQTFEDEFENIFGGAKRVSPIGTLCKKLVTIRLPNIILLLVV
eukprot:g630.t1